jgi:arylsulfatase A-like enzyme
LQLAVAALVLTDLVFYRISLDHLRPSFFELGTNWHPGVGLSSLSQRTDALFYLALFIALAGGAWLVRLLWRPPVAAPRWQGWGWAAGILLLAGIPSFTSERYFHLNEHLFIVAARDWAAGNLSASLGHRRGAVKLALKEPPNVDHNPQLAGLAAAAAKLRNGRQPNVVLVVMESVGALNLLTQAGGGPSPVYAPNLARLARHGVLFDSVYVPAPATARSHTTLHTGGRVLTRGGPREMEQRYQGAMLGRSMRQLGYNTAVFSSQRTDVEGMDAILDQGGYDRFQTIERDVANLDPANLIHSWGAREEYTVGLIEKWVEEKKAAGQPFYVEYINAASHHPYGAPADYRAPFSDKDDRSQYLNSLHYTDSAVGYLVAMLARKGLLDDTVIAVTGDHGEAFGDRHKMNTLHKNFIYEENVRSFLLLMDPRWGLQQMLRPSRIGSNGDIMPTLLAYLQAPDPTLAGRNLLAETFEAQPVHFFKNARPEQWGLRDGKWKFIAEIRSGRAELYDLMSDPGEQRNLAGQHRERAEQYAGKCEEWFLSADQEYTARLENYRPPGGRKLGLTESFQPGPKLLALGVQRGGRFTEAARVKAQERAIVWTRWAEGRSHTARWQWRSPSGVLWNSQMSVDAEWTDTYSVFPGALPMERGNWTVTLMEPAPARLLTRLIVD